MADWINDDMYGSPEAQEEDDPNAKSALPLRSVERESGKAYLVIVETGQEMWLPKSCCTVFPKVNKAHVPNWLLEKKGLGDYIERP